MKEQDIQRGFNKGYLLSTHSPALATKFKELIHGRQDGFAVGFLSGVNTREQELEKIRAKSPVKRFNLSRTHINGKNKIIDRTIS